MALESVLFAQFDFKAGMQLPAHEHSEAQLLFARSGTLDLLVGQQLFVLPSSRFAWIPPHAPHAIRFRTHTQLRTAYVPGLTNEAFPRTTSIFQASELFRAILLRLTEDRNLQAEFQKNLEDLLLVELTQLRSERFSLKLPKDPRAEKVAEIFLTNPADNRSIEALAREAACSSKTLGRLFVDETEMTFKLWRRHVRLLAGLELLESGSSVTQVAYQTGFSTPSAFTEAFRLTFGYPPSLRPTQL